MVLAKINEPKSTGFDDPRDWSDEEMKDFLKKVEFSIYSGELCG
jgi:hypothetical protein